MLINRNELHRRSVVEVTTRNSFLGEDSRNRRRQTQTCHDNQTRKSQQFPQLRCKMRMALTCQCHLLPHPSMRKDMSDMDGTSQTDFSLPPSFLPSFLPCLSSLYTALHCSSSVLSDRREERHSFIPVLRLYSVTRAITLTRSDEMIADSLAR